MCEHCQSGLNLIEEYGDDVAKYLWIEENKLFLEIYHKDGKSLVDHTNIKYCPICGEKLI